MKLLPTIFLGLIRWGNNLRVTKYLSMLDMGKLAFPILRIALFTWKISQYIRTQENKPTSTEKF